MNATTARKWATKINTECSECFTNAKAVKRFGQWVIDINGGSAACYGRTIKTEGSAKDTVRIFGNDPKVISI